MPRKQSVTEILESGLKKATFLRTLIEGGRVGAAKGHIVTVAKPKEAQDACSQSLATIQSALTTLKEATAQIIAAMDILETNKHFSATLQLNWALREAEVLWSQIKNGWAKEDEPGLFVYKAQPEFLERGCDIPANMNSTLENLQEAKAKLLVAINKL